jgi:preprotein translocase subunit YajC
VTSSSYTILTSLLPFLLLFGFWSLLMRNYRAKQAATPSEQQQILAKLEEIRTELERLRKATAERDSDGFGFRS